MAVRLPDLDVLPDHGSLYIETAASCEFIIVIALYRVLALSALPFLKVYSLQNMGHEVVMSLVLYS